MIQLKQDHSLKLDAIGVSLLFYNMGLKNLQDRSIFDIAER